MSRKLNNDELNFIMESNKYIYGGTKIASVITRNAIKNTESSEDGVSIIILTSEELKAIKTLVAGAMQNEDYLPERWHCDSDCQYIPNLLCHGECSVDKKSEKLCKFFIEEN